MRKSLGCSAGMLFLAGVTAVAQQPTLPPQPIPLAVQGGAPAPRYVPVNPGGVPVQRSAPPATTAPITPVQGIAPPPGFAPAPGAPSSFGPPADMPQPKIWSGNLEVGLNGSEGNSQVLKMRLGNLLKRATDTNIFTFDQFYGYSKLLGVRNENKYLLNVRDEFLFAGSPWSLFVSGLIEYDEFRAYDFRVGGFAGVSYQCIKDDTMDFKVRGGAGVTHEVGGPNDRTLAELIFGWDYEWKLDDRSKFIWVLDYYPNVSNFSIYRIRTRAAYEFMVCRELNLALRFGIQDRYDSTPGPGTKANDLDYFATLLFKF